MITSALGQPWATEPLGESLNIYACMLLPRYYFLLSYGRKRERETEREEEDRGDTPPAHTDIIGNGENDNLEFKRRQSIVSSLIAEILSLLYPHT